MSKDILKEFLDLFPKFYYREPDGNHYKYSGVLSEAFRVKRSKDKLVKLSKNLTRPLKLWREQIQAHIYKMKYEVNLENIKRVQLYQDEFDDNPVTLLVDSGELPEGVDYYTDEYSDTDDLKIIPDKKFFINVETWDEDLYTKGFPENDTPVGDRYDHDAALDMLGNYYGVPRRTYKTDLNEGDYPYTTPTYCVDKTEWDYVYENRIKQCMIDYRELNLVSAEVKKYFDILPLVEGRWRYVCRQNVSNMAPEEDAHYMATKEWNSGVFDVTSDLNAIPANIEVPSVPVMQGVINRAFPLGKKAYFNLTSRYPGPTDAPLEDVLGFYDNMNFTLKNIKDVIGLYDEISASFPDNMPIANDIAGFYDYLIFHLEGGSLDYLGLYDQLNMVADMINFNHDTPSDFSSDTLTGCSVSGSGSSAYVKLNPLNTYAGLSPSGQFQSGTGWSWINPSYAVDSDSITYAYSEKPAPVTGSVGPKHSTTQARVEDGNPYGGGDWIDMSKIEVSDGDGAYASATTSYRYTNILRATGFGFNVPTNATITGISVRIKRRTSTTVADTYDRKIYLVKDGSRVGSNHADTNTPLPSTYSTKTYGSSSDTWGTTWTPSQINSSNFGVDISFYNDTSYNPSFYIDYVDITVYYTIPSSYTSAKKLNLTGLNYSLPSGTQVVGVKARIKSYCEMSDKVFKVGVTAGGVTKIKSSYLPTTVITLDLGSDTDLWGGLPQTPSSYNSVTMSLDVDTTYRAQIYYVTLYVYYKLFDGTVETAVITAPGDGYSWNKIEASQTIPSGTSIYWDVLKGSDGSVLLGNKTIPIDIKDLNYDNIKLKAKLHTNDVTKIPTIDWFRTRYKKEYM